MTTTFSKRLASFGRRPAAEIEDAAERLLAEARAAAKLRSYQRDPDVAALTIERTRERVERVLVFSMTCGLLYTTVNVQDFVAGTALAFGLAWWAAWLVEPFVTTAVLALLRIEQVARRNQVIPGPWVRWTRWVAFGVTYVFNTWHAWGSGDFEEIVKHSAIPVLVFFVAEALTDGRDALTAAAVKVALVSDIRPGIAPDTLPDTEVLDEPETSNNEVHEGDTRPDINPDTLPDIRRPKGYLKEVAIPAAYRELAVEVLGRGGSLDEITLGQIDARAGTSKYVTKAMITPLREQLELERTGVRDGATAAV